MTAPGSALHDPLAARRAGRDELSLALIDARNRTLRWWARFEAQVPALISGNPSGGPGLGCGDVMRCVGGAGWFQEFWIARHLQRARGEAADASALRLPSIHPQADAWFAPCAADAPSRPGGESANAPDAAALRQFLADTLELTLDLLHGTPETDEALHMFRLALWHEDRLAERLAVLAQWMGVDPGPDLWMSQTPRRAVELPPVWLPAGRVTLGTPRGGLVPPSERWAHEVRVPECEIDLQAVSWARFAEFVDDGGYDDRRWWSAEGWRWLQADGRRSPRGVAQWRGGVSVERFGQLRRIPSAQAAVHVTWHESQAWCQWAGRRLPTEAEWVRAQAGAAQTGFVWGEVLEWMLGPARPWAEGLSPVAGFSVSGAEAGHAVLRGASAWTVRRMAHPQARRFVAPFRDDLFCGFRSCAL